MLNSVQPQISIHNKKHKIIRIFRISGRLTKPLSSKSFSGPEIVRCCPRASHISLRVVDAPRDHQPAANHVPVLCKLRPRSLTPRPPGPRSPVPLPRRRPDQHARLSIGTRSVHSRRQLPLHSELPHDIQCTATAIANLAGRPAELADDSPGAIVEPSSRAGQVLSRNSAEAQEV